MLVLFKIIGLLVGFKLYQAQGAILGLILGHALDAGLSVFLTRLRFRYLIRSKTRKQMDDTFLFCAFAMLAKLVKIDGAVTREEVQAVEHVMRNILSLSRRRRKKAVKIFRTAKDEPSTFHSYAMRFYQVFGGQPQVLQAMLEILRRVALADGPLHDQEIKLLNTVANIFNLELPQGGTRIASNQNGSTENADVYTVLGAQASDSMEDIRRKYRKLVSQYHPDKVISKGLPEEFISFANRKFQEIQQAYDSIKKTRAVG